MTIDICQDVYNNHTIIKVVRREDGIIWKANKILAQLLYGKFMRKNSMRMHIGQNHSMIHNFKRKLIRQNRIKIMHLMVKVD
jgi:hypothetical protein